jgi:hypothetical protein
MPNLVPHLVPHQPSIMTAVGKEAIELTARKQAELGGVADEGWTPSYLR